MVRISCRRNWKKTLKLESLESLVLIKYESLKRNHEHSQLVWGKGTLKISRSNYRVEKSLTPTESHRRLRPSAKRAKSSRREKFQYFQLLSPRFHYSPREEGLRSSLRFNWKRSFGFREKGEALKLIKEGTLRKVRKFIYTCLNGHFNYLLGKRENVT